MATVHVLLMLSGIAVMGVGFLLGRVGDRHRERHTRLATTMPASTGRTTTRGPVELRGTIVPAPDAPTRTVEPDPDGTFTAPVGGHDDAVLTAWRAVEGRAGTGIAGSRRVATGFRSVPFYVDDGSGPVLVDPGSLATRDFEYDSELGGPTSTVRTNRVVLDIGPFRDEVYVPSREAATPALREWILESPHLRGGDGFGDRRYEETNLRVGDEVYVVGYARRDTGRAGGSSELLDGGEDERFPVEDAVVTHPVDGSRMLLSTRPKELLLDESADGERIYRVGSAIILLGFALAIAATLQLVP
jgi:hypothetical protein